MLQHEAVGFHRRGEIAVVGRLLGQGQGVVDRRAGIVDAQLFDEGTQFGFGLGAHEAVDGTAAAEGIDGRDRLDAQLRGDALVLVDVDLDQLDLAVGFLDHLFDGGPQLAARPAPGRPEIDDHRAGHRLLDDIGHEGLFGTVDDVGVCAGHGNYLNRMCALSG